MKKIMAGILSFLMVGMIAVEADAASRVSSSSRSSMSSMSRSVSSPKSYPAPARSLPAPSRNVTSTSSNPGLKALGFSRPATNVTAPRPSASVSSSRPVQTSTTSTGWFGKKTVSSTPAYRAPVRQISSPSAYRRTVSSGPRTTVIQRNYYSNSYGGYNGYNRGYGGYGYNPYGGYSSGGSNFMYGAAGAIGGMMLYNALATPHHGVNSGASAAQIEQAKTDQRIEDKLDALKEDQNRIAYNNSTPVQTGRTLAIPPVVQQPQCFLPTDAPLMMNPQFYCGGSNAN